MNAADFDAKAQEWIAAWNAHDLDRIMTHYSEEIEFASPFIVKLTGQSDGTLHGKGALRDYFERGLRAYPQLRFELIRLYAGVHSCVVEYRSVQGLRAAEVMEFNERGEIRRVRAHYTEDAVTS